MLIRLFKNDLIRGKMNTMVMLLFIMISAMLSCASVSLLYSSTHQISYFMNDMGNVADLNFTMMNTSNQDKDTIIEFLEEHNIKDYYIEEDLNLPITSMEYVGYKDFASSGCFATTLPKQYNLLYDEDNNIPTIGVGEVGVPLSIKKQLKLSKGDILKVNRGTEQFEYRITSFLRDSLFGSDMMGQKRFIFHEEDYKKQNDVSTQDEHTLLLSIKSSKGRERLEFEMQKANLPNYIAITKDTAYLSLMGLQAGSSAIMLVSGIILLCIGFLIIRFTILYQIEENYTEIGIMKAIGLSHAQIKPLYLTKYVGLAFVGSSIGFVLSIPFCNMLEHMQTGVVPVLPTNVGTYLSSIVIVCMVLLVYIMTAIILRRIKKQSAMDAIRKGNEGETFKAHAKLPLSKLKHCTIPIYLAISDVFARLKNTFMIICIYAFALLLILIPLMLKDTFTEGAFLDVLNLSRGDLYTQQDGGSSVHKLKEKQKRIEKDLQEYDKHVSVNMEMMASTTLSDNGVNTSAFLMKRALGNDAVAYNEGKAPLLKNEVAMSSTLADKYDKTVGDSIVLSFEGTKKPYLITGIYESMMNLGNNMLAGEAVTYDYAYTGYLVITFSGSKAQREDTLREVQKKYHVEQLIDTKEMIVTFSGDMASQVGVLSDLMSMIFLFIVFAISILFAKMQIIKSKKSITILQGLGYHMKYIRRWQMWKCLLQISLGVLLGIVLHLLISAKLLRMFFETIGMGNIRLEIGAFTTFLVYPFSFFVVVVIAQILVNRTIFKWNVKDLSGE